MGVTGCVGLAPLARVFAVVASRVCGPRVVYVGKQTQCGKVEIDQSFIGGKARNMHAAKKARVITGMGGNVKEMALGTPVWESKT